MKWSIPNHPSDRVVDDGRFSTYRELERELVLRPPRHAARSISLSLFLPRENCPRGLNRESSATLGLALGSSSCFSAVCVWISFSLVSRRLRPISRQADWPTDRPNDTVRDKRDSVESSLESDKRRRIRRVNERRARRKVTRDVVCVVRPTERSPARPSVRLSARTLASIHATRETNKRTHVRTHARTASRGTRD